MVWWSVVALAGGVPQDPVWLDADPLSPRTCVSFVPEAGPFKRRDTDAWSEVRAALEAGDVARAAALVRPLKPHPARRTVLAAAYLAGEGLAIDLEPVVEKHPDDPCLRLLAAAVASKRGDVKAAARHVDAAAALWPEHPDVRLFQMSTGASWKERAEEALRASPDDVRLLTAVAQLAEQREEPELARRAYGRLVELGEEHYRDRLAALALHTGDLHTYLSLALPAHPAPVAAIAEAVDKAAAFRAWLGLTGPEDRLEALFVTDHGTIRCQLHHVEAPITVMNFVALARGAITWSDRGLPTARPLYDGTIFHRVIPGFMIQGGDPEGTGRGGPGYRFADEPSPRARFDRAGLLAMANAGPDTNGSQFFITEVPTPHLSGRHTIFGACDAASQAIVRRIARVETDDEGRPYQDVVLREVRFERVGAGDALQRARQVEQ